MKYLIRGGKVIDGSGMPAFTADVAIDGSVISELGGRLDPAGRIVIDADGLIVSPGFIDIHTHSDRTIFDNPLGDSKVMQGVTTEVTCNCGIGPFPVSKARRSELEAYLNTERGSLPGEGISWEDFSGFAAAVENIRPGINLAMLVAHGALRIAAMGSEDREPTAEELAAMEQMLDISLAQGAWGMSTGMIYPPGSFARTAELIALSKILARHQALYSTHVRNESGRLLEAVDEAILLSLESGVRVEISHLKAIGVPNWGNALAALRRIEAARESGLDVWADQYPYEASSTSLSALVPGWVHDGGVKMMVERLGDAALKNRILADIEQEMTVRGGPERVKIAALKSSRNARWIGKTIGAVAVGLGLQPADAVRQLLYEEAGAVNAIYFSLSQEDLEGIMVNPDVAVGSDGQLMNVERDSKDSVHPRSYGTFARVLGRYARELNLLPLETAVRKMTGLPAQTLRLGDRGMIAVGRKADITIFDAGAIIDHATFEQPHQYASGVQHVMVNGTFAVKDGQITGFGRGEVLRKKR